METIEVARVRTYLKLYSRRFLDIEIKKFELPTVIRSTAFGG